MARPRRSAALAALVICPLIGASIGVWLVSSTRAAEERAQARARAALVTYLDLVRHREWAKACAIQDDTSELAEHNCEDFLSSGAPLATFTVGGVRWTRGGLEGTFIAFLVSLTYADESYEQIEMRVGSKVSGYPDTIVDGPSFHTRERPYDQSDE